MSQNSAFLHGRNALGKLELDIARAREAKAAADLGAIRVRLDQCSVVAPYDGRVVEILVREHETPAPGNPVLSILSDGVLEIEIIVPSSWLAWIKTGTAFEFAIDETGTRHDAVIERLGAAVDPVSQTIKIVGRLAQHDARILPGMSGTARFDEGIAAR
jgi:multidrug efflux pump subunit AcrA (membrane-fusion protein)